MLILRNPGDRDRDVPSGIRVPALSGRIQGNPHHLVPSSRGPEPKRMSDPDLDTQGGEVKSAGGLTPSPGGLTEPLSLQI